MRSGYSAMNNQRVLVTIATVLMSAATTAAVAQDYGGRTLRFGNTSGWYYDGRDDNRDFPANGVFPGNFAVDPANTAVWAAGIFGSTPWRSAMPYPSKVIIGSASDPAYCSRRRRPAHPFSGPGSHAARYAAACSGSTSP
jgi:hypothetical protein